MSEARISPARLRQLAAELPDHYTVPLLHLSRARILTGRQLDRLLQHPDIPGRADERARQRAMAHLCHLGLAATLDRRIGGMRAGSAGYVHVLTPAGHKLAALLTGQQPARRIRHSRAPGTAFIAHALDIAEIYVQLTEKSRSEDFRVAAFITEPDSWWRQHGVFLRPDAYTRLATSTHRDCWWLEIDRDTESAPRLREKFRDYLDHADNGGTGPDGVLPRVLITAPNEKRADTVNGAIAAVSKLDTAMFTVTTRQQAADMLVTELDAQPPGAPIAGQVRP